MPTTKHSIVLNITGNAKQEIQAIANKMQEAGTQIAGAFEGADISFQDAGPDAPPGKIVPGGRGPKGRGRGGIRGVAGGLAQTGMGAAAQVAGGGRMMGAAGGGLMGVAGFLGGAGVGALITGMAMKFASSMADSFDPILKEFTKVAGATGDFNLEGLQNRLEQSISGRVADPAIVRQIANVTSRATGTANLGGAAEIAEMATAMNTTAETMAQFDAFQRRFNTGTGLRETMAKAVAGGMKSAAIDEALQGQLAIQEQLLQQGVSDATGITDLINSFGKLDGALRGKAGAQLAGGISGAITGAARGGGPLQAFAMAALQRQGMDYFQSLREMEKGITGKAFEAVVEEAVAIFGQTEQAAEVVSSLFGISLTNADKVLQLVDKEGQLKLKQAQDLIKELEKGNKLIDERTQRLRESDIGEKLEAEKGRKEIKEHWGKIMSDTSDAFSVGTKRLLEGGITAQDARKGTVKHARSMGLWGTTGFGVGSLVEDLGTLKRAGKKADVAISQKDIANAYFNAIVEANRSARYDKDPMTISKREEQAGIEKVTELLQQYIQQIQNVDKDFTWDIKVNTKSVATGDMRDE